MASVVTTPTVLSGLFKEVYGDNQISLIPDNAKLQKMIPFVGRDKELGNYYHQNVVVTSEHGISYAAADAGAFALNDSVSLYTQDAKVQGSQMLIRSALSYDAAARASNNKKAFVKSTSMIVENMVESMAKRLEISLFYGQSATGLATAATAAVSGSAVVATITDATWAPGMWCGAENARVAVKVGSDVKGPFYISAVDFDNKTLTLKAATETNGLDAGTGVLTDIQSQATVYIFWLGSVAVADGSTTFREMIGLDKMITTSGSIFNINNSTYNMWAGNSVTKTGQLTLGKILSALGKPISKGLEEDVTCFVHPDTWQNLASDLAALRRYDGSYDSKEGDNGFKMLTYYAQNGKIDVISHNCVKGGDAFVIPVKRFKRVGAQDISVKTPGREEEIFIHLQNSAGYELRAYCDQALFPEALAKCLKISGFTNV
jgi:hypothetical protein